MWSGSIPVLPPACRELARLRQTCQEYLVITSCGGGLYTHKYRAATGFVRSIYCADLPKLITHISGRLPRRPRAAGHSPTL